MPVRYYKIIFLATIALLHVRTFAQISYADSVAYSRQLIQMEQQFMDDIAVGVTGHYQKYMHPNCFIITEDGTMLGKQAFLADFQPLPKGFSGYIKVIKPKTVFYGNTAVIQYVSDEYENVYESKLHTMYSSMNTYIRTDTLWQMISSTIFEVPLLPPPVKVPASILKKYTGTYQLSDSITCNISLEHDTLFYQRAGRAKTALLPETENIFFRPVDTRGRKLFVTDEKGVMLMRERRNGQDVVWKRIKL
jgi:hypothetical protein